MRIIKMTFKRLLCLALLGFTLLNAQSVNDLKFGPQNEKKGQSLDKIVAFVGNDVITQRELRGVSGKNRNAYLQQLIMKKLLLQEAQKYNINVNDTALNISQRKKGQKNTRSSRNRAREELAIAQLQQKVVNNLVDVSDREVADIVNKQLKSVKERVKLIDVLIKVPQSADTDVLNQAQVKAQEIIKQLKTQPPQSVASAYADVAYNNLGWIELAKVPPRFSRVLLDTPKNQYTQPIVDQDGIHLLKVLDRKQTGKYASKLSVPETRTSHILIKNSKTAKKTINSIYNKLKKGANFSQLAVAYSQDEGSAASGGDLNWVRRGQMVPKFEQVMRNTPTGAISRPFKTQFGYHILKVNSRRNAKLNNRKALEQRARQQIFKKKAAEEWDLWLARLRDESYVEVRQ